MKYLFVILFFLLACAPLTIDNQLDITDNTDDESSDITIDNKISPPLIVAFYSEAHNNNFVVAPGEEFEVVLHAQCLLCENPVLGSVKLTFERIDPSLTVEFYEVNDTINISIPPDRKEHTFDRIRISTNEKGYHLIRGTSELVNTAEHLDYQAPANIISYFSINICVVEAVTEIENLCQKDSEDKKYVNHFATNSETIEYIGSIERVPFEESNEYRAERLP